MNLNTVITEEVTARSALDDVDHPLNQISFKLREACFNVHRAQLLTYMKTNKSELGY